ILRAIDQARNIAVVRAPCTALLLNPAEVQCLRRIARLAAVSLKHRAPSCLEQQPVRPWRRERELLCTRRRTDFAVSERLGRLRRTREAVLWVRPRAARADRLLIPERAELESRRRLPGQTQTPVIPSPIKERLMA